MEQQIPTGIANEGTQCFLISSVLLLDECPEVREKIVDHAKVEDDKNKAEEKKDEGLSQILAGIFEDLRSPGFKLVSVANLRKKITEESRDPDTKPEGHFGDNRHEDLFVS
jgi:hypothetical protein